jgi:hypothetical protein
MIPVTSGEGSLPDAGSFSSSQPRSYMDIHGQIFYVTGILCFQFVQVNNICDLKIKVDVILNIISAGFTDLSAVLIRT